LPDGVCLPNPQAPSLIVLIVDNGLNLNRHPCRSKTTGPWSLHPSKPFGTTTARTTIPFTGLFTGP
jgi:hypothetical protein